MSEKERKREGQCRRKRKKDREGIKERERIIKIVLIMKTVNDSDE